jgi:signal peptidase I
VSADPERAVEEDPAAESGGRRFWEQAGTLVLALLIALGIRAFAIEPFRIPSGSMFPTLLIGDHLFVNRFVYGIEIPFTDVRLPGLRTPERGEVVVFSVAREGSWTFPADQRPDLPREEFVKRVVGLPGDLIRFRDGVLYVNEAAVAAVSSGEWFEDDAGRSLEVLEATLGERHFRILDDPEVAPVSADALVLAEDRYFMLGDNRDHSKDSRFWGTVRLDEIRGPAFLLYWSWDFKGGWLDLLDPATWWNTTKRWDRIGARLE